MEKTSKPLHRMTPIKALRLLSGIFQEDQAVNLLFRVNLLARWLDKDKILDRGFLLDKFRKMGIELDLGNTTPAHITQDATQDLCHTKSEE